MKVKDVKPMLEKRKGQFSDLQHLELKLQNDSKLCEKLNKECGTNNILEAVREARMLFYDKEISRIEKMIDEAEISGTINE